MDITVKQRDYGFDNIKFILIILVVFGHIIEEISLDGFWGLCRALIYSFHMPAFVFASGYFASKSSKNTSDSVITCLIPYFIFNTAFLLLVSHGRQIDPFEPKYAFWFLLSLFFWRVAAKPLSDVKGIIVLSFIFALIAGGYNQFSTFLSLSRTVCFLPFFMIGYKTSEETIGKLRSINKIIPSLLLIISLGITAFLNIRQIMPIGIYTMSDSYGAAKQTFISGAVFRAAVYLMACAIIFALVCLIPNREFRLSKLGSRTICIYIFSSFIIKTVFNIIDRFDLQIPENIFVQAAFSVMLTAAIISVTGNRWICKSYNYIFDKIRKLMIR